MQYWFTWMRPANYRVYRSRRECLRHVHAGVDTMNEIHGTKTDGNRSPRAGVADRKGHHHAGVLSAVAERAGECLQPEVESGSSDAVGRKRGARGAGRSAAAAPGWTRARRRQPRDQIRTAAAGGI